MIAFAHREISYFSPLYWFFLAQSSFIVVGAFYHELLNASPFFHGSLHIAGVVKISTKKIQLFTALRNVL